MVLHDPDLIAVERRIDLSVNCAEIDRVFWSAFGLQRSVLAERLLHNGRGVSRDAQKSDTDEEEQQASIFCLII